MQLHQYVSQCTLHDGRQLYLVNDGYPVNLPAKIWLEMR